MKLITQVKLETTEEQSKSLTETLEAANSAANAISVFAWDNQVFRQFDLHHFLYRTIREQFCLSAQVAVRILAKVADAYKADKKTMREFNEHGSIAYDSRILSWRMKDRTVSIWTVDGRIRIPFLAGERQVALLQSLRGEADLILCSGTFYLNQTCDIPEPPEFDPKGFLGVDFGIANLATTSKGETFSGAAVDKVREKKTKIKKALQKRGSKSAKRHLKKLSGKEARFKKNTNHVIAKKIVSHAKDTCQAIVIENLKGIRGRTTVRKAERDRFGKWSFDQLRNFLTYKARLAGVPVIVVNPRNTSRTCSECGFVSKKNRKSQALFLCIKCGYTMNADWNAAINIASKGRPVTRPIAVHSDAQTSPALGTASPSALAVGM